MEVLGEKGAVFMHHGRAGSSAETMHRTGTDLMQAVADVVGYLTPWLSCVEAE